MSDSDQTPPSARLACLGWEHSAWVGPFYPEDMPPEWRLAYFNTQFHGVFLPRAQWLDAGAETWAAWCEECHEQFQFLLEAAAGDQRPASNCLLIPEGDKQILWFDHATDLKALGAQLRSSEREGVIWLISRDADLGQIERVRTLLELLGLAA